MKGTVPGTPGFRVLLCRLSRGTVCLSGETFPCLKGGVRLLWGFQIAKEQTYISEPGLLTPENLRVPLF